MRKAIIPYTTGGAMPLAPSRRLLLGAVAAHAAMRDHKSFDSGIRGDVARSALADFLGRG